jgi:hypothetical protein
MRTQTPDTRPEAERILLDLLRQAPAWRKLSVVEDANYSVTPPSASQFQGMVTAR